MQPVVYPPPLTPIPIPDWLHVFEHICEGQLVKRCIGQRYIVPKVDHPSVGQAL